MDNERAPEASQTEYLRLPWFVVATGLAVLLAAALAVGLLANRSLNQQVALPTATPAPALAAPPTATRVAPTPTSSPPTATPQPPPSPTPAAPTATSEPALAPAPTPRPTVDPALADEVSQAYERYWEVRAHALLELDESHLSEVMAGDHLKAISERIDQLRTEGRAIATDVDHKYVVVSASADRASVADRYVDNSLYVDFQTRQPLGQPTGETLNELYGLEYLDGQWRVVSLVRAT